MYRFDCTTAKKNNTKGRKSYISTGLRHIFAIVSLQISSMVESSDAILKHEITNRWLNIHPSYISFLSKHNVT